MAWADNNRHISKRACLDQRNVDGAVCPPFEPKEAGTSSIVIHKQRIGGKNVSEVALKGTIRCQAYANITLISVATQASGVEEKLWDKLETNLHPTLQTKQTYLMIRTARKCSLRLNANKKSKQSIRGNLISS